MCVCVGVCVLVCVHVCVTGAEQLLHLDDDDDNNMLQIGFAEPLIGEIISLEDDKGRDPGEAEEEEGGEGSVLIKPTDVQEAGLKTQPSSKPGISKSHPLLKFGRPPPPMGKRKTVPSSAITTISSSGEVSPPHFPPISPSPLSPPALLSPSPTANASLIIENSSHNSPTKSHHPPAKPPRSAMFYTG